MQDKERQTKFRSPIRRSVRQRSGFTVSGQTTGSECKLKRSKMLNINTTSLMLTFEKKPVQLTPSFNRNLAFVAFGGYFFPRINVHLSAVIKYIGDDGVEQFSQIEKQIARGKWEKFGVHCIFDMEELKQPTGMLKATFEIKADANIGKIDFFGFDLGTVYYYTDKDLWDRFQQKTKIYLPEIYYFDMDEPFAVNPKEYRQLNFENGRCVIIKSCNRCARYLLIDIENERNTISFSNHCISEAPCRHTAFSIYKVIENECERLPEYILRKRMPSDTSQVSLLSNVDVISKIQTYYGYQLACRSCKKYYVNAPLNPMRDSTQHREDSLRRRALEVLVDELLEHEWIYHTFKQTGTEFDVYIWEKFGKRCFNCGRELKSPKEMAVDHTMPLAMLWPLDETATCLCSVCNSQKRDKFPIEFYSEDKLKKLADITGLSENLLRSKQVNMEALEALKRRIQWFFDEFLMAPDYQKVRGGKRASDLTYKAIQAAIKMSGAKIDLVEEYNAIRKHLPKSISIENDQ